MYPAQNFESCSQHHVVLRVTSSMLRCTVPPTGLYRVKFRIHNNGWCADAHDDEFCADLPPPPEIFNKSCEEIAQYAPTVR